MAGQQGTSNDWSEERSAAALVRQIPGLLPGEAADLIAGINRAVESEVNLAKRAQIIAKVKGLVEGAASGGVPGLFAAALKVAVTG